MLAKFETIGVTASFEKNDNATVANLLTQDRRYPLSLEELEACFHLCDCSEAGIGRIRYRERAGKGPSWELHAARQYLHDMKLVSHSARELWVSGLNKPGFKSHSFSNMCQQLEIRHAFRIGQITRTLGKLGTLLVEMLQAFECDCVVSQCMSVIGNTKMATIFLPICRKGSHGPGNKFFCSHAASFEACRRGNSGYFSPLTAEGHVPVSLRDR